jgi:hypothetical protein
MATSLSGMRTKILIIFAAALIAGSAASQSSKQVKKNSIKSVIETRYDYDTGVEISQVEQEQFFDDKGELIELKVYSGGKIQKHEKYSYDNSGNKIKEVRYDSRGKITRIYEYKYSDMLRTERIELYPNGKVKSKRVYSYEYYD